MVEKIFRFLASRHRQNVFPRLKGHNQNYVSWRDICNMLKNWIRRNWWAVPLDSLPPPLLSLLSLALMEVLYGTDIPLNTESENLTLRLCLHYIARPFCVSEFVSRILQGSLAQFFNSHWHDYSTVKIIFFLRWHDSSTAYSSTVVFTVEEWYHVLGIRHTIP